VQVYSGLIQRGIYKQAKRTYQQSKEQTRQEELKLAAAGSLPLRLSFIPESFTEPIRSVTPQQKGEGSGMDGSDSNSLSPGSGMAEASSGSFSSGSSIFKEDDCAPAN
jgi:hypothetical protein